MKATPEKKLEVTVLLANGTAIKDIAADEIIFPGETQDSTSPPAEGIFIIGGASISYFSPSGVLTVAARLVPR